MAKKLAFDKVLFTTILILVAMGLTAVFSASAAFARDQSHRFNLYLVKQGLAALLGLVVMWVAMHIDYRHLFRPRVLLSSGAKRTATNKTRTPPTRAYSTRGRSRCR